MLPIVGNTISQQQYLYIQRKLKVPTSNWSNIFNWQDKLSSINCSLVVANLLINIHKAMLSVHICFCYPHSNCIYYINSFVARHNITPFDHCITSNCTHKWKASYTTPISVLIHLEAFFRRSFNSNKEYSTKVGKDLTLFLAFIWNVFSFLHKHTAGLIFLILDFNTFSFGNHFRRYCKI